MGKRPKKQKKPKQKVIYYDDGSTIADMSAVGKGRHRDRDRSARRSSPAAPLGETPWQTYCRTVRMMIKPMLFVLLIIAVLFVVIRLITAGAS